jgi:hypothetical protein
MTANGIGNNAFSGTLYETRGPAFSADPFDPKAVSYYPVGTGALTFGDANNGTFAFTVNGISQTKPITRTVFGNLPVCTTATQAELATATNYQDIWWVAAGTGESGWGLNFTHQGDTIFTTWFTYDFGGMPLWRHSASSVYCRSGRCAFAPTRWKMFASPEAAARRSSASVRAVNRRRIRAH